VHGAKYWFLEQNLPEELLKSVSELPLLVYGRSGLLQDNPQNPIKEGELWEKHAAPISSVYFNSANMDLYKERIQRLEGTQLFPVRW
jgi:SPX domain protein involved in polyphosphate accumulation